MKAVRLMVVAEGPTDLAWLRMILPLWLADQSPGADQVAGPVKILGPDDAADFLPLKSVPEQARRHQIRASGGGEEALARKAILLLKLLSRSRQVDAAVVLRDLDDRPERAAAYAKAKADVATVPVAIGTPKECREAWYLCGVPPDAKGVDVLRKAVKKQISFDPLREPERLSHKETDGARSAKKVAARFGELVSDEDSGRRLLAVIAGPPEALDTAGKTGARAFIMELNALASLFK